MFVKYTTSTLNAKTGINIVLPINTDFDLVDLSDSIRTKFVESEIKKNINPIEDLEIVRYIPYKLRRISKISYNINLLNGGSIKSPTYFYDIGFDNDDIKFQRNVFKDTYLNLNFFDNTNPFTQNKYGETDIYTTLSGNKLAATNKPVIFTANNPSTNIGNYEGYYIYNNRISIGEQLDLYLKASFFNAKIGKETRLVTVNSVKTIDKINDYIYTKITLTKTQTGFYYFVDNTFSNNVTYIDSQNGDTEIIINLFEIQVT